MQSTFFLIIFFLKNNSLSFTIAKKLRVTSGLCEVSKWVDTLVVRLGRIYFEDYKLGFEIWERNEFCLAK
jgi:hypothetical protein